MLREFAADERGIRDGARWSYCRDLERTRLIVLDSRCGRVLEEGRRSILDEEEWEWLEEHLEGDFDHLLIGTSDPFLLAPGLHHVERWGEALCAAAPGASARRELGREAAPGARLRSLGRLRRVVRAARRTCSSAPAPGGYGPPPASITVLSGDVHHAYLAEVAFTRSAGVQSARLAGGLLAVSQRARRRASASVIRLGDSRAGRDRPRALARLAGVRAEPIRWRLAEGPYFDNQVATLTLDGREARAEARAHGRRSREPTTASSTPRSSAASPRRSPIGRRPDPATRSRRTVC